LPEIRFINKACRVNYPAGVSDEQKNILLMCKDPMVEYYKKFGFHYIALSNSTHGGVPWHEMSLCL